MFVHVLGTNRHDALKMASHLPLCSLPLTHKKNQLGSDKKWAFFGLRCCSLTAPRRPNEPVYDSLEFFTEWFTNRHTHRHAIYSFSSAAATNMSPIQGPNKSETQRFQKRALMIFKLRVPSSKLLWQVKSSTGNMYNKNWHFGRGPLSTHLKFGMTSLKRGWPVSGNPY